jgi:S-adenosylhomocysteine hydrolase
LQVDEAEFAGGKRIILQSEGRLVNLGNVAAPALVEIGVRLSTAQSLYHGAPSKVP